MPEIIKNYDDCIQYIRDFGTAYMRAKKRGDESGAKLTQTIASAFITSLLWLIGEEVTEANVYKYEKYFTEGGELVRLGVID